MKKGKLRTAKASKRSTASRVRSTSRKRPSSPTSKARAAKPVPLKSALKSQKVSKVPIKRLVKLKAHSTGKVLGKKIAPTVSDKPGKSAPAKKGSPAASIALVPAKVKTSGI